MKSTFAALIKWRIGQAGVKKTAEDIADSLSGERLSREDTPGWLDTSVTAFRHLRRDARVDTVRAFLNGQKKAKPKTGFKGCTCGAYYDNNCIVHGGDLPDKAAKPSKSRDKPKAPEKPKTFIAVCGYLSQKCSTAKEAKDWLDDRLLRCTYPRGFIIEGQVTVVEKNFQGLKRMMIR